MMPQSLSTFKDSLSMISKRHHKQYSSFYLSLTMLLENQTDKLYIASLMSEHIKIGMTLSL